MKTDMPIPAFYERSDEGAAQWVRDKIDWMQNPANFTRGESWPNEDRFWGAWRGFDSSMEILLSDVEDAMEARMWKGRRKLGLFYSSRKYPSKTRHLVRKELAQRLLEQAIRWEAENDE